MIVARDTIHRFGRARVAALLLGLAALAAGGLAHAADCVILLHGLGRGPASMARIQEDLERHGFVVWNRGYESTAADIRLLAEHAVTPALDWCAEHDRTHFVTHSLGGILVRVALGSRPFDGRIVMLSPPNHGSEIADALGDQWPLQFFLGPALTELDTDGLTTSLDTTPGTIGIITGDRSSDPWFSWLIPGADDGKVSVDGARLEEMTDFLVVHEGHSFIMLQPDIVGQVRYFLVNGRFRRQ